MKQGVVLIVLLSFFLVSCEVVEAIFMAGFFSAVLIGVLLIVPVIWVANRLRK